MAGNHKDSVPKQMRFRSMWTCAIGEYKTMCSKFLTAFRFDQSQILEYSCPCVCHSIASGAERRASFNKFHKTQGIFPDSFLARASACTYLYTDSAVKHMYNSPRFECNEVICQETKPMSICFEPSRWEGRMYNKKIIFPYSMANRLGEGHLVNGIGMEEVACNDWFIR